jgi:uncharacterized membrane protein
MTPDLIFNLQLGLGYVPWLLIFGAYVWPWVGTTDRITAHRAFAALNSFRFFGLVFLVPGVVGPNLPAGFTEFAAYGDFVTGLLAMLALMAIRLRLLFWVLVAAFNLVGAVDIIVDYFHGRQLASADFAGQLGAAYGIVIVYVPLLMVSHVTSFVLLLRPQRRGGSQSVRAGVRP